MANTHELTPILLIMILRGLNGAIHEPSIHTKVSKQDQENATRLSPLNSGRVSVQEALNILSQDILDLLTRLENSLPSGEINASIDWNVEKSDLLLKCITQFKEYEKHGIKLENLHTEAGWNSDEFYRIEIRRGSYAVFILVLDSLLSITWSDYQNEVRLYRYYTTPTLVSIVKNDSFNIELPGFNITLVSLPDISELIWRCASQDAIEQSKLHSIEEAQWVSMEAVRREAQEYQDKRDYAGYVEISINSLDGTNLVKRFSKIDTIQYVIEEIRRELEISITLKLQLGQYNLLEPQLIGELLGPDQSSLILTLIKIEEQDFDEI